MTVLEPASQQIILRTRGVGKVFGKFVALNNISAEFAKGAITCRLLRALHLLL